jgi:hypothetical protein
LFFSIVFQAKMEGPKKNVGDKLVPKKKVGDEIEVERMKEGSLGEKCVKLSEEAVARMDPKDRPTPPKPFIFNHTWKAPDPRDNVSIFQLERGKKIASMAVPPKFMWTCKKPDLHLDWSQPINCDCKQD